jgi:mRNA interferase RelE/StbE
LGCKPADVAAYALDIRPRARRSLRQLDPVARKAVAEAIDNLAVDPRPPGARALTGHRSYLRVRSCDYRVMCLVDDRAGLVTVAVIGHRREVYRTLDL